MHNWIISWKLHLYLKHLNRFDSDRIVNSQFRHQTIYWNKKKINQFHKHRHDDDLWWLMSLIAYIMNIYDLYYYPIISGFRVVKRVHWKAIFVFQPTTGWRIVNEGSIICYNHYLKIYLRNFLELEEDRNISKDNNGILITVNG